MEILQNGKYKVEFTGEFSVVSSYEIEVQDSLFVEMESGVKKKYKIDWKSKNVFQLELISTDHEILTEIISISPSEYPYYEMTKFQKDTIIFNYHQGMGISTVTGRFIRIEKQKRSTTKPINNTGFGLNQKVCAFL